MDYKDLDKSDEEAVKDSIKKAVEEFFPKEGDLDYWGPIGNGWYQLGKDGYTGKAGWDLLQKALQDELKKKVNE